MKKTIISVLSLIILSHPLTAKQSINIFKNMPKFKSTKMTPVKLNYKFTKNQIIPFKIFSNIGSSFKFYGKKINVNVKMNIKGNYKILDIKNNGNTTVATTITKLNITAPGKVNYDSLKDKNTEDPRIKFFNALVNNQVIITIDKYGKLLKTDMKFIEVALKNLRLSDMKSKLDSMSDQIIKSTFTILPKMQIKTGMTYDSGTLTQPIYKIGLLNFIGKQKVISVSADGKKVILKPSGYFKLKPLPGKKLTAKMNKGRLSGWILFDRSKGYVTQSSSITKLDMMIKQNKMTMPIKMTMTLSYSTDN